MKASDAFDFNDDDDDRPRRRRRDDDFDDRPRRRERRRHEDAEEDYLDDFSPRRRQGGDGMGQGAMITGIISLAVTLLSVLGACFCGPLGIGVFLGMIGGIVAVILGFVARSRTPGSGMGLTGILTGFGSILVGLLLLVLMIVGIGFLALNAPKNAGPRPAPGPGFNNQKGF